MDLDEDSNQNDTISLLDMSVRAFIRDIIEYGISTKILWAVSYDIYTSALCTKLLENSIPSFENGIDPAQRASLEVS